MITINDKGLQDKLKSGTIKRSELTNYLVRNVSVYEIADELAGHIIEDALCENNMIILSQAQAQLLSHLLGKLVRPKRTDVGRKARTEKYIRQNQGVNIDNI